MKSNSLILIIKYDTVTGLLAGIEMSHSSTTALCRAMKLQCELNSSRQASCGTLSWPRICSLVSELGLYFFNGG